MLQIMYNSCVLKIEEQNLGLINSKISDDVFNYSRQTQTIWNTKVPWASFRLLMYVLNVCRDCSSTYICKNVNVLLQTKFIKTVGLTKNYTK